MNAAARHGRSSGQDGFVLIIVLWVTAMLTVLTLSLGQRAVLDAKAARYAADHAQARMMARSAVYRGMLELQHKVVNDFIEAEKDPEYTVGVTHLGQPWAKRTDLLDETIYFDLDGQDFSKDAVFFEIEDEAAKIDINRAPIDFLGEIKILDGGVRRRIEAQRMRRLQDRMNQTYFQTIDEIRFVDGVTDEAWEGENGEPGLKDIFSVYGDANTEGKININTATLPVIESIPGLDESGARAVLTARGGDPVTGGGGTRGFGSMAEVSEVTGLSPDEVSKYCMLSSTYFKITGVATRQGGRVRARCTAVVHLDSGQSSILAWREDLFGGQIQ